MMSSDHNFRLPNGRAPGGTLDARLGMERPAGFVIQPPCALLGPDVLSNEIWRNPLTSDRMDTIADHGAQSGHVFRIHGNGAGEVVAHQDVLCFLFALDHAL